MHVPCGWKQHHFKTFIECIEKWAMKCWNIFQHFQFKDRPIRTVSYTVSKYSWWQQDRAHFEICGVEWVIEHPWGEGGVGADPQAQGSWNDTTHFSSFKNHPICRTCTREQCTRPYWTVELLLIDRGLSKTSSKNNHWQSSYIRENRVQNWHFSNFKNHRINMALKLNSIHRNNRFQNVFRYLLGPSVWPLGANNDETLKFLPTLRFINQVSVVSEKQHRDETLCAHSLPKYKSNRKNRKGIPYVRSFLTYASWDKSNSSQQTSLSILEKEASTCIVLYCIVFYFLEQQILVTWNSKDD